ncbi:anti-sigma factor domain-containing protein [Streptomyces sp. HPF1205]|uniref:anti-sigma factor n=1 Tax=Streptomyces sp. HPF1205 TaxID=2873262 RepID=UPI001CECFA63|nr:anti-sigma factor [Streptomyces sp. HPF1205]
MTGIDLHTLTGAYAVSALSKAEAEEFGGHLAQCPACTQEVRELRETAARLALAVAEVPPAAMRARVMEALPDVRQLPPEVPPPAEVRRLQPRRRRRLPHMVAAACLVIAAAATGVAVNAQHEADSRRERAVRAEQQAQAISALAAAPDAAFHTGAVSGGGTATVLSSARLGQAALLYHDLPKLPGAKVYELWYSKAGTMVPAGLLDHGRSGGATMLRGAPSGADGVGLTVEPDGGSTTPSSAPLAVLPL